MVPTGADGMEEVVVMDRGTMKRVGANKRRTLYLAHANSTLLVITDIEAVEGMHGICYITSITSWNVLHDKIHTVRESHLPV